MATKLEGEGSALVAGPPKKSFFAASLTLLMILNLDEEAYLANAMRGSSSGKIFIKLVKPGHNPSQLSAQP